MWRIYKMWWFLIGDKICPPPCPLNWHKNCLCCPGWGKSAGKGLLIDYQINANAISCAAAQASCRAANMVWCNRQDDRADTSTYHHATIYYCIQPGQWPPSVDNIICTTPHDHLTLKSASRDNWCTVGGDGGCRVGEVRAGTTSPMPDHKGFKLQ